MSYSTSLRGALMIWHWCRYNLSWGNRNPRSSGQQVGSHFCWVWVNCAHSGDRGCPSEGIKLEGNEGGCKGASSLPSPKQASWIIGFDDRRFGDPKKCDASAAAWLSSQSEPCLRSNDVICYLFSISSIKKQWINAAKKAALYIIKQPEPFMQFWLL